MTGRTSSQRPKTRISDTAQTNSGIAEAESPPTETSCRWPVPRGGPPHAAEDPERDDEQEGDEGELRRVPERRSDHLVHRAAKGVGLAQVALDDPGHPVP